MRVAVLGAGSIGCYIGGRLQANGHDVVYIGRDRLVHESSAHGLTLTDYQGWSATFEPGRCEVSTSAEAALGADVVLVATKSAGTAAAAGSLAALSSPVETVVSLQNGVRNAGELTSRLGQQAVVPGMVSFNVAKVGPGQYHQGSQGKLVIGDGHPQLVALFEAAGLSCTTNTDMTAVQWGKLVLNLNNAVNGLSGLPLKDQLGQRDYRRVVAKSQREALQLLRAGGQRVVSPIPAPLPLLPLVLDSPDIVFSTVARQMVAVDPKARSSLFDDLAAGKPTEIDYINGEVVALAERLGRRAPVNEALVRLVHSAERDGEHKWSGRELLRAVTTPSP